MPPTELPGVPTSLLQDTPLVDLVCAAMLHYTQADVASTTPCTTDANIEPGQIRRCDVSRAYKFSNTLYTVRMTGAQLRTYLEWSAATYRQWQPDDLTLAFSETGRVYNCDIMQGVTYVVDVSREVGSRVSNLAWPDGTPVADDDSFVIAVSNYRAGTDLLTPGVIFAEGEALPELIDLDVRGDIGGVRDLLTDYIENVCNGKIEASCDNSWQLVGCNWDQQLHEQAVELVNAGKIDLGDEAEKLWLCTKVVTKTDLEAALA